MKNLFLPMIVLFSSYQVFANECDVRSHTVIFKSNGDTYKDLSSGLNFRFIVNTWQECYQKAIEAAAEGPIGQEMTIKKDDSVLGVVEGLIYWHWDFSDGIFGQFDSTGKVTAYTKAHIAAPIKGDLRLKADGTIF